MDPCDESNTLFYYVDKSLHDSDTKQWSAIKYFSSVDICITEIKSQSKHDISLYVNDDLAADIIPKVHDLPQIKHIYIYSIQNGENRARFIPNKDLKIRSYSTEKPNFYLENAMAQRAIINDNPVAAQKHLQHAMQTAIDRLREVSNSVQHDPLAENIQQSCSSNATKVSE
ncbi:unnamed protein product [Didymodactylos carnosus]|uniref:Uncharacterized protein n=1 Tax=Didymodactylos carnosus TaxID=1234261 RepID=A0A815C1P9_9BILA|nr:unnamed protein product [Didymodactylos carnosus]CAF1278028.1 unnamed protein product [Didymodactylos carnosus]CAF3890015.1 unnamed protein product [Didymodactylos carnosus]CAF4071253.1 unnamed protein product [Didymodactylos carnosus]